jgi:hypothetical protein
VIGNTLVIIKYTGTVSVMLADGWMDDFITPGGTKPKGP